MELLHLGKKPSKDLVTPHKIALMGLVKTVCSSRNGLLNDPKDVTIPRFDNSKQKREFAIATLELIQGPDLNVKEFLSISKDVLSESLFEDLTERSREVSCSGVCGLMDFIQSMDVMLVDPNNIVAAVHRSSVIGLFLRRMILAFDKLSFGQMAKLYRDYCDYCSTALDRTDNSTFLDSISSSEPSMLAAPTSRRQAELYVARQVALMQTNERIALPPPQLQSQLRHLIGSNLNMTEAHFLSLMNCLRSREYCGAVHSLHQAFDCHRTDNVDLKSDETPRNYRFAALNLSSLLSRFGFREEAILALSEAMRMARVANDNICLQHALGWLYRLEKDRKDILVERSISKTRELSLPYLTSLGLLTYCQLESSTFSKPAKVFEFVRKNDILNCQHSILELMTQSYGLKANLWRQYGKQQMVSATAQLLLHLNTSEPTCRGFYHSGEPLCSILCHMATQFQNEGKYVRAEEVLSLAKTEFPGHSQHSVIWMVTEQILHFERALWQGQWDNAEDAQNNLALLDLVEGKLRKAQLLLYKQETSTACQFLNDVLVESCLWDTEYRIRILVLLGQCYCHANQPSTGLLHLKKALTLAQQHHLKYWQAISTLHLAHVQYLLGHPNLAIELIDSTRLSVYVHCTVLDRGRIQFLHANCLVKKLDQGSGDLKPLAVLGDAVAGMELAAEDFVKMEAFYLAKEAFHSLACLYHRLGQVDNRNRTSLQFRQLNEHCGSTTLTINNIL